MAFTVMALAAVGCASRPVIVPVTPAIVEKEEIVPVLEEKIVFSDKFDDNLNGWTTNGDHKTISRIEEGHYFLENKKKHEATFSCLPITITNRHDFIIESKIIKIAGKGECSYGITWGADPDKKNASFIIIFEDYILYGIRKNNEWETLINWQRSTFVNRNPSENKIAVRRFKNELEVFVNEHRLLAISENRLYGNNFGFILFGDILVKADFFLVTEYIMTPDTAPFDPETATLLIQPGHTYLFIPKEEDTPREKD